MAFDIELSRRAEIDIYETIDYIARDSAESSRKWFDGLFSELEHLRELPERFALIPEAADIGRELRSFHYHSHRVVFEVKSRRNLFSIVRVYHGSRQPLSTEDVE